MKRLFLLLILLLTPPALIAAQDDTGWPVIERCVGEPTTPPEGWNFDGVIFLRSYDAIRGLKAGVETPYSILFADDFFTGASPSPDGHWYAVPSGTADRASLADRWYHMDELVIYSTDDGQDTYRIPWVLGWRSVSGFTLPIVWLDNQHLIYAKAKTFYGTPQVWIINPFTGEEHIWDKNLKDISLDDPSPVSPINSITSPDLSRTIFNDWQYSNSQDNWKLGNFDTGEVIRPLTFSYYLDLHPIGYSKLVWHADSSGYASWMDTPLEGENSQLNYLRLFDRDGNLVDIVTSSEKDVFLGVVAPPDATRLMFFKDNHWFIADLQNQIIIDTCLDHVKNLTLSPDGKQAVFNYQEVVVVSNFETHQSYIVGSYDGDVDGWRTD